MPPTIGITVDNKDNTAASGTYECAIAYSVAVTRAGGVPIMLPHEVELVEHYLQLCDGFILTGGVDPLMEQFGEAMHPKAKPMDPRRQAFELALLDAVQPRAEKGVLGVCLGMQLMGLHAGGRFNQHLPDTLPDAKHHEKNTRHAIVVAADSHTLPCDTDGQVVVSYHNQAMETPGRLRAVATAADGVLEAIEDPDRPFYLGVQWHPERGGDGPLNQGLIERLVAACRATVPR